PTERHPAPRATRTCSRRCRAVEWSTSARSERRQSRAQTRSAVHSNRGRTTPRHWPVNRPRDESPCAGSWTWNDTASWTETWWWSFGESIEQTAASTLTSPSLSRFPGIHAVATYSPGEEAWFHRGSVSIALNATWPAVVTLSLG